LVAIEHLTFPTTKAKNIFFLIKAYLIKIKANFYFVSKANNNPCGAHTFQAAFSIGSRRCDEKQDGLAVCKKSSGRRVGKFETMRPSLASLKHQISQFSNK